MFLLAMSVIKNVCLKIGHKIVALPAPGARMYDPVGKQFIPPAIVHLCSQCGHNVPTILNYKSSGTRKNNGGNSSSTEQA